VPLDVLAKKMDKSVAQRAAAPKLSQAKVDS
jgi:hypothetical protein